MKPDANVTGMPFNFDAIPLWLYPDVWDETKHVQLRGLWFVLLYSISFMVFFSAFMFVGALIFSRSIWSMLWFALIISVPGGFIVGVASWWDFTYRRKKLLFEEAQKKSEAQSHEPTQE